MPNQEKTQWKIFRSGQYSGLAMFYQPEPDVGEDDSIYHLNGAWESFARALLVCAAILAA